MGSPSLTSWRTTRICHFFTTIAADSSGRTVHRATGLSMFDSDSYDAMRDAFTAAVFRMSCGVTSRFSELRL
jgi:hypothetical protein